MTSEDSIMKHSMTKQDFLFELGCEELPPKALIKIARSLHDYVATALQALDLHFVSSEWFATPRRLAFHFIDLDTAQADKQIEKLGPAVAVAFDALGEPKPAAIGFAKSNAVKVKDLTRKQTDKGERLAFIAEMKGKTTRQLLPDLLQKAISQLPIPKSMRWGDTYYQFSRPVHWILAMLGEQIIDFEMFGKKAGNKTLGHRFHSPDEIGIAKPSEYVARLEQAKVIVRFKQRAEKITSQIKEIAKQKQAHAVVSDALLEEVTALVEWPVALLGSFDEAFLQVPSEALISSMAEHQKYFHLIKEQGELLPYFITVSNIESKNPSTVIEGNEKVIRPRLSDAKFFYDSDCKQSLESHVEKLKKIVFQKELGSLYDKTQRIKILAEVIAAKLHADPAPVARAASLCQCDLMTEMVNEFSDLQGVMGRYYAKNDGETKQVVASMDEIYMPRFSGDQLPQTVTGLILALANRIDTLLGIFAIEQIPTGAKDPFALRRAALGVLRIIIEKELDLDLSDLIDYSIKTYVKLNVKIETKIKLLSFFSARMQILYQDKKVSLPIIRSVQALNITKPSDFDKRIVAVQFFDKQLGSEELSEANKRVKNILAKSDFDEKKTILNQALFNHEERALHDEIINVKEKIEQQIEEKRYLEALKKLAGLKQVVNLFFDKVMINVEDIAIRNNRLALINELRNLFIGIADISLLQK